MLYRFAAAAIAALVLAIFAQAVTSPLRAAAATIASLEAPTVEGEAR